MIKKIISFIVVMILCITLPVYSMEWACDKNTIMSESEIKELYINGIFVYDGRWVTGCTYKPLTDSFNKGFMYYSYSDISAISVNLKSTFINSRFLKIVNNNYDMENCIITNAPAVGYIYIITTNVKKCNESVSKTNEKTKKQK